MVIKFGTMVTVALNIKEYTIILEMNLDPGKVYFARGYAHIDAIRMCPTEPIPTTKRELNK